MNALHSQIGMLENDLAEDEHALDWFNVMGAASITSTRAASEVPSTPLSGAPFLLNLILHLKTIRRYLILLKALILPLRAIWR